MVEKNIQMKGRNGTGWDNLYPFTYDSNVKDAGGVPLTDLTSRFKKVGTTGLGFSASLFMGNDNNIFSYQSDGVNFSNMITLEQNNLLKIGDDGTTGTGVAIPIMWIEATDHISILSPQVILPPLLTVKSPSGTGKDLIAIKDSTVDSSTGVGVRMGAGGLVVIGSGESSNSEFDLHTDGGEEQMYITSDNAVFVKVGYSDGTPTQFTFGTDGSFKAPSFIEGQTPIANTYATITAMNALSTSTYTNLTLNTPVITYGSTARYTKRMGVVYIEGAVKGISATPTTIATLPTGYRPPVDMSFALPTSGKNFARWVVSASTGNITLENVSQAAVPTTADFFPITMSFLSA